MCFKMTINGNVRMSVNEYIDFVLYCEFGNSSECALNLISTVSGDLFGCITNFLIRGFEAKRKEKRSSQMWVFGIAFFRSKRSKTSVGHVIQ